MLYKFCTRFDILIFLRFRDSLFFCDFFVNFVRDFLKYFSVACFAVCTPKVSLGTDKPKIIEWTHLSC